MVLIAFRHGLRASELVDLRWDQVDLEHALLHVRRVKQGSPATHPLTGKELRALRRLQRDQVAKSPFVFISERGAPFSTRDFGPSRPISATSQSCIRSVIPSWHRLGSKAYSGTDCAMFWI
jgi:integrase